MFSFYEVLERNLFFLFLLFLRGFAPCYGWGKKFDRFQPNLSHWLLYSSALDVSQDMYSADWGHRSKRLSNGLKNNGNEGLSMTLDRPPKTVGMGTLQGTSTPVRTKLSSYPPVLGYLATLTRSKASKQLRRPTVVINDANENEKNESSPTPADQLADRSGAVRRLSGLFTKNSAATAQRDPATMTAAKIKNKLSAAPGILKTALFRSRSKDSFLDSSFHQESSSAVAEAPWQHKSSVPCYVGWRPPMPLPKDCPVTDHVPKSSSSTVARRVVRTESRRSNLGWRKYSSESDLLDASESGYMAIDRIPVLPSWPPTLALLTPIFGRFEGDGSPYSLAANDANGPSMPHTLPRKFQSDWLHASSPSLRVQFNLDQQDSPCRNESPSKKAGAKASEARQVKAEFEEYSLRLKQRLKLTEGSPWYDLWTPNDPSVRLCEIAQL